MSVAGKLVFIVGNSRSGTTMLGRMLGRHAQVHTFGELHFFEQLVDAATVSQCPVWTEEKCLLLLERLLTSSREGFFAKVQPGKYKDDALKILEEIKSRNPVSVYEAFLFAETTRHGKFIPCEQTPRYLFYVQEILSFFPEAIVINLVRDPRDVLLSQKNKWRRRFLGARNIPMIEAIRAWSNYHPYTISRLWVAAVRTAKQYRGHPRFVSIRFEDLLTKPEETVRTICGAVGLDYSASMLEVPQIGSSSGMDNPQKCGVDSTRIGSWRKGGVTEVELAICEEVCGSEMRVLGYECANISVGFLAKSFSMSLFVFKIILALALNLRRTRNLVETLRRRLGGQV